MSIYFIEVLELLSSLLLYLITKNYVKIRNINLKKYVIYFAPIKINFRTEIFIQLI